MNFGKGASVTKQTRQELWLYRYWSGVNITNVNIYNDCIKYCTERLVIV